MKKLKVCFMGGKQAGLIGFLRIRIKEEVLNCVSYSSELKDVIKLFNIPVYDTIKNENFKKDLRKSDLLISVHGREIVPKELLELPRYGAINIHPYLYKYKGASPVKRALMDREFKASVGVHKMTERIDEGKVIVEEFIEVREAETEIEVYNSLYFIYSKVIIKALDIIRKKYLC